MVKTRKNILSSDLIWYLSLVLFRIVLDYVYVEFMHRVFMLSYLSFDYQFDMMQYLISWGLYLVAIVLVKKRIKLYSDFFFLLFLLIQIAPLTSIYGLDNDKALFPVVVTVVSFFVIYIVVYSRSKRIHIPIIKNANSLLLAVSVVLIVYLVMWSIITGAIRNFNLDFTRVYEFRMVNSKLMDLGPLAYINIWVYKFFMLFLFCYFLYKQRFWMAVIVFLVQTYFYGITAHKAVFFYPFLCLIVWVVFHRTNKAIFLVNSFMAVILVAYLIYDLTAYSRPATMMIRRVFFVQPRLTFEWFDFFSRNPHVFWSDKILSFIFKYPYESDVAIPYVVGTYLLSPDLCANNGFISSGYAHAGIAGVMLYSVLLGVIIRLFDQLIFRGLPLWFVACLTAIPTWALNASDLFTVLLSHGLLLSYLILVSIDVRSLMKKSVFLKNNQCKVNWNC